MSFGKAGKPSLEGSQVKSKARCTTGLLEQNHCYVPFDPVGLPTRHQKLYPNNPRRTGYPHICDCHKRMFPLAPQLPCCSLPSPILMKVEMGSHVKPGYQEAWGM